MAEIIWTKYALDDLKSIYEYISHDSFFYAGRLIDKLVGRTDILINNPQAGKIVKEFENPSLRN